jgi:hypothetical protein
MSKPAVIKIDDVEYVRSDTVDFDVQGRKKIVVLQRGWVVIGNVEQTETEIRITNCSVIRIWGTTKGLGEIAEGGPTSKTVLDPCPPVTAHPLSVVFCMYVNEANWK